jgi:hypothetical protein
LALLCATGALVATAPVDGVVEFPAALGSFVLAALCVAVPLAARQFTSPTQFHPIATTANASANADAGDNWGEYLRSDPRYAALHIDAEIAKIPAWLGLASLVAAAFGMGTLRVGLKSLRTWDSRPGIQLSP